MAIDVRSRQVHGKAPLKEGAPALAPEQLGARLWSAFKGLVASFVAPVPSQARGGVLQDVLRLLGGKAPATPTMGQLAKQPPHVSPRAGAHFEDVVSHAGKEPIAKWTDNAVVRARDTLREVAEGLPRERLERDLFALPPGSVLHEDGALEALLKRAPQAVEVRRTPYLNTIDEVARFLEDEVKKDGKAHAQEVNGALIEVRPGGSATAAVTQWEQRRKTPADEKQATRLLGEVEREIDARQARAEQHSIEQRRAALAAQLKALPPGAEVFAHDPEKLRAEQPGVGVRPAPFLLTLEEAAAWLAKQASSSGKVSAYRFNDHLLIADPGKGRGEALVRSVLDGWDRLS